MVIILAALRWEVAGILALLEDRRRITRHFWKGILAGRRVAVMLTGIGAKRRYEVADFLRKEEFSLAISLGLAGAVNPKIKVGSVICCDEVCVPSGRAMRVECGHAYGYPVKADIVRGKSLTVSRVVLTRRERERIFHSFQVDIVEMESFHLAELLSSIGKPLTVIRAISDTAFQRYMRPWEFVLGARMARRNLSMVVATLLGFDPALCLKLPVEIRRTYGAKWDAIDL